MPEPENPFLTTVLAAGRHFADRAAEVKRIRQAYREPAGRLVVVGERRMGKTSALHQAAGLERKRGTKVAVATFATATDAADAARQILLAVREQIGRNWRAALESMVGRLQGGIELRPSPLAGAPPSVRITFGLREEARTELVPATLTAIAEHVSNAGGHLALALDEFQRIHEWGGEAAEWALKAAIERHRSLSYVFAGSQRGLVEAMISRKGRALWKQADVLSFGAIDPQELAEWIHQQAARTGAKFTLETCDAIVSAAGPRTRDVVQLAREVWFEHAPRGGAVPPAAVQASLDRLVGAQAALYAAIWRERTAAEQRILRALVAEPGIALTSAAALQRYQLGPKSTVQATTRRLVAAEYLVDAPGGGLGFDDPFFRRWLALTVLPGVGLVPGPLAAG